jgi:DNA-binding transcriptional LysR family regulator
MPASKHRTVRRLTYFAAIARAGTIRAAARELGVSVPVLSSALSELEAELGLTLATRSTRSFQLTSAGEAVYARAQSILSQLDSVLTLATTDRRLDGQLGITLPIELTASWLPERLARYRSEHPNVSISIDARDEVVELRDSAIDIAVRVNFLDTDDGNNTDPGIDRDITQPGTEHLQLVCVSAEVPQFKHANGTSAVDLPFLICPGNREWIAATSTTTNTRHVVRGSSLITVSNRLSALALASHGLGFTLTTMSAARDYLDAGLLVPMFPELCFGELALRYVFRDQRPSAEAQAFHRLMNEFS